MFASHLKIERQINEMKKTITEEELFSSKQFQAYLLDFAQTLTGRYDRNIRVETKWDTDGNTASTDNFNILINCANPITLQMPNRKLMADSLLGLLSHEAAHILFTDFKKTNYYKKCITNGTLYPKLRSCDSVSDDYQEMEEYLKNGSKKQRMAFYHCVFQIVNIMEDAAIESRMSALYPGSVAYSIQLFNEKALEQTLSIWEQIELKYHDFAILCNLMLQYCLSGNINNFGDYEGEYMEQLLKCTPILDEGIYEEQTVDRFRAANMLMGILWKYAKDMIEQYEGDRETQSESEEQSSTETSAENINHALQEQISSSAMPTGNTSPIDCNEIGFADQQKTEELKVNIKRELEETDTISVGSGGRIIKNNQYKGSDNTSAACGIEKALQEIGKEKAYEAAEAELKMQLQQEAGRIRYGNAHVGVDIMLQRMLAVPESYGKQYQKIAAPIEQLGNRMAKLMRQALKDRKDTGKLSGFLSGNKIHLKAALQNERGIFYKNKMPNEKDLAVSVLIDQSGSMNGLRIHMAQAAAIAIYHFCCLSQVPVMITGHDYDERKVNIYAHVDFDSLDGKDRFRLMDIHSGGCNRDGAAIRYVAEKLLKRPEKMKLLLLISDGLPNADGYKGTEAEADLRGIKKEYSNRGILFFAAAIGDDKEAIQRIYGNSYLDMTNLHLLPKNLVKLVSAYVD